MKIAIWLIVISIVLIIFSFYFTLSFIESLKAEDKRVTSQYKFTAITFLGLALLIPAFTIPFLI